MTKLVRPTAADGYPKTISADQYYLSRSFISNSHSARRMRFVPSLARTYGNRRLYATAIGGKLHPPQTIIEKVVQKYAVGLPDGKVVKAGDYVMIRPEHVMTHDNTGPVISKFVYSSFPFFPMYLLSK